MCTRCLALDTLRETHVEQTWSLRWELERETRVGLDFLWHWGSMGLFSCLQLTESKSEVMGAISMGLCYASGLWAPRPIRLLDLGAPLEEMGDQHWTGCFQEVSKTRVFHGPLRWMEVSHTHCQPWVCAELDEAQQRTEKSHIRSLPSRARQPVSRQDTPSECKLITH